MSVYGDFARVYDLFMQDAPYPQWLDFLQNHWSLENVDVVDVGCGTGILTVPLARQCRTCVGVDRSEAMLSIGRLRSEEEQVRVAWMCQDVLELRLPSAVQLAVSTCDVVNYMSCKEDVVKLFTAIHRSLRKGGSFAFDAIGPKRVQTFQKGYWHQIDEDAVLLHETNVDGHRIDHDIHMFVREEDDQDVYQRIEEQHVQWFYDDQTLLACLELAGFAGVGTIHDFSDDGLSEAPDRYVFFATS